MKAAITSSKNAKVELGGGKGHSVLIIDDEPALQDIYSTSFKNAKWTVFSALNGGDGLDAARSKHPDVILLDLVMPVKDGFETLRTLKSDAKTKDIPVVILSNLGQDFEVKLGLSLGALKFLVKASMEPVKLIQEVTEVVGG